MTILLVLIGVVLASAWGTGVVRRFALRADMLDRPTHRSSHTVPTPRGGGLAIAVPVFVGVAALAALDRIQTDIAVGLIGGGVLIAGIGFIDDRRPLSPLSRLAAHVSGAVWAVGWMGGLDVIDVGVARIPLGLLGTVVAVVGIVWLTNLYNFMDGIDGLAAGEGVAVGAIAGVALFLAGARGLGETAWVVAAGCAGFLVWNWHPARIFMGDVGSGLLGFLFGALAIRSAVDGALPLMGWVILLGVFVFDATVTLIRRAAAGARWYEAHRDHAYQRLVRAGFGHRQVTTGVLAVNLALGALTLWSGTEPRSQAPALVAALLILGGLYLWVERQNPFVPSVRRSPPGAVAGSEPGSPRENPARRASS